MACNPVAQYNDFTGDGSTKDFTFTFPYLNKTEVQVRFGEYPNYTYPAYTTEYTVSDANPTVVTFVTAPANGDEFRIFRCTDGTNLPATFQAGSAIRAADLNDNFEQMLYLVQDANVRSEDTQIVGDDAYDRSVEALNTANQALDNSEEAIETAERAEGKADAALEIVAGQIAGEVVQNVSELPATGASDLLVYTVIDSTGIENFSPLTGLPPGFVGDDGMSVKLQWQDDPGTYIFLSSQATDSDHRYVQVDGDNMTGNLTFNTDKIQLKTDGSATFAGNILVSDASDGQAYIDRRGYVNNCRANGSDIVFKGGIGTDINSVDTKTEIKADGSATFAGRVTGKRLDIKGGEGGSPETALAVYDSSDNENASITADGSATFAGNVVVNHSSASRAFIDGFGIYQTNTGGNNVISLLNDGSATFASYCVATGVTSNAYVQVKTPDAEDSATFQTFQVWDAVNSGSITASITGSGNASFAGNVQSNRGDGDCFYAGPSNDAFASACYIADLKSTNGPAASFFAGNYDGSRVVTISKDGSATFAGNVGIGTTDPKAPLQIGELADSMQLSGADLIFNRNTSYIYHKGTNTLRVRDKDSQDYIVFDYNGGDNRLTLGAQDYIGLRTNGADRVRITSTGNVGIGTNDPERRLHVVDIKSEVARFTATGKSDCVIGFMDDDTTAAFKVQIGSIGDDLSIKAGIGRVRVKSTGEVGIGTDVPSEKLNVKGNILAGDPSSFASSYYIAVGDKNAFIKNAPGEKVKFGGYNGFSFHRSRTSNYSEDAELVTILDNGNVGIGTVEPEYTLDVNGYIRTQTGIVFPDGSTQTTAQTGGGGTPSNMVTTDTTQSISGTKNFNTVSFSTVNFSGRDKLTSQGDGFQITRDGSSGNCGNGTGGMVVRFQDAGDNVKVGIRNNDPSAGVDCCATIKANQYQDRNGNVVFNGQLFTSEIGIDFNDETRFHDDVVQEGNLYSRIPTQPLAATASISTAERAVAVAIRAAFRGFVHNGTRQFSIDKQSLVDAFTDNGLDIADYGIMSEIIQPGHNGFEDSDLGIDTCGVTAETYSVVNYRALFAFALAAGPDLSALEARLTALENA